jgi:hypothetical protein
MSKKKIDRRIIYSCGYSDPEQSDFGPCIYDTDTLFDYEKYTPTQMRDEISRKEKALKAKGWTYVKIELAYCDEEFFWVIYGWKYESDEDYADRLKAEEDRIKQKKLKDIERLEGKLAKLKSEVDIND